MIQKYEKSLGLGLGLEIKSLALALVFENYAGLGLGLVGLDNKVLFTSLLCTFARIAPE